MNTSNLPPLFLSNNHLIGRGRDRACYRHPNDPDKCIKISIVENDKQSKREPVYYKKLINKNIPWGNIAQYFGKIETSQGKGLVFELVRDFDGEISKSLLYHLEYGNIDQKLLAKMLAEIKSLLLSYHIFTRDISPNNLLFKKDSDNSGRLVIIDGLGNAELIPVSECLKFLAKRKITRKWNGLIKRLATTSSGHVPH